MSNLVVVLRCGHPDPASVPGVLNPLQVLDRVRTHEYTVGRHSNTIEPLGHLAEILLIASQPVLKEYCAKSYGGGRCRSWHVLLSLHCGWEKSGAPYVRLDPEKARIDVLTKELLGLINHPAGMDFEQGLVIAKKKWDAMRTLLILDQQGRAEPLRQLHLPRAV